MGRYAFPPGSRVASPLRCGWVFAIGAHWTQKGKGRAVFSPGQGGEWLRSRWPGCCCCCWGHLVASMGCKIWALRPEDHPGSAWETTPPVKWPQLSRRTRALPGGAAGTHTRARALASLAAGFYFAGLKDMQRHLRDVDCLLEVHDARIPFSGRNPILQEALGIRPHLLVLNKMDLADLTHKERILQHLEEQGHKKILFTECLKDENVKQMVPILTELISNSLRYQRSENPESSIMVIGIPNVGKSSVINSIRRMHLKKGKASLVGGAPGITRAVLTRIQVCDRPLMYLLDTPGVLTPRIENVETGLKLALCGAIHDHMVGAEVIADYLLYTLNRQQQFRYVELYGLDGPCDDIESVLKRIAQHLGKTSRVRVLTGTGNVIVKSPNYNAAANHFIQTFRKGTLGKVMLDQVP